MRKPLGLALAAVWLAGCSSAPPEARKQASPGGAVSQATGSSSIAKYVELAGFRLDENGPGKLQIRFALINHSDADLGDVTLKVDVRATTSRPGEGPLFSFPATVQSIGPNDVKDVTVTIPTKLRIYELPDWQFLRADFKVTSPQ